MNRHPRFVVGVLVLAAGTLIGTAAPNRYGHSDRVERHMLPSLSTTPLDPAWSPDGKWLAFSMRGDIWKIPAEGGEAVALTKGPAYHYEPAWSPDGSRIALTMDVDGNLDIGVVSANGGDVERLTTDRRVDVEPAWSHDGASLYFVTARGGNFDIYRYRLTDHSETPFVAGPRDQIQPSESPDGQRLAFVSPVDGRLGTGGIWVRPLSGGEPTLVHYEETEYRDAAGVDAGRSGDPLRLRRSGLERHRDGSRERRQPDRADSRPDGRVLAGGRAGRLALRVHLESYRSRRRSTRRRSAAGRSVSGPKWCSARAHPRRYGPRPRARARRRRQAGRRTHLSAGFRRPRLRAGRQLSPRHRDHRDALLPHDGRVRDRSAPGRAEARGDARLRVPACGDNGVRSRRKASSTSRCGRSG